MLHCGFHHGEYQYRRRRVGVPPGGPWKLEGTRIGYEEANRNGGWETILWSQGVQRLKGEIPNVFLMHMVLL